VVIGRHCPIGGHATCARGHTSRDVRDRYVVTSQSALSTDSRDGTTTRVRKRLSGVDQRDARTPPPGNSYRAVGTDRGRRVSRLWCAAVTLSRSGWSLIATARRASCCPVPRVVLLACAQLRLNRSRVDAAGNASSPPRFG